MSIVLLTSNLVRHSSSIALDPEDGLDASLGDVINTQQPCPLDVEHGPTVP